MKQAVDVPLHPDAQNLLREATAELDPRSAKRGWARMQAEIRRPRRPARLPWVPKVRSRVALGTAVTLMAAALLVAVVLGLLNPPTAVVLAVEGDVHWNQRRVVVGDRIPQGEALIAAERAVVRVGVGDRAEAILTGPGTVEISAIGQEGYVRLGLEEGKLKSLVRPGASAYEVSIADWSIQVLGTVFTVEARFGRLVELDVQEGRVRVQRDGVEEVIPAPGRRRYQDPVLGVSKSEDLSQDWPAPLAVLPVPASWGRPHAGASSEPSPPPEVLRSVDGRALADTPPSPTKKRRRRRRARRPSSPALPPAVSTSTGGADLSMPKPNAPVNEGQALLAAADAADLVAALPIYEQASQTSVGELALFRGAERLQDAGRAAEAADWFQRVIAEAPAGSLRRWAQLGLVEVWVAEDERTAVLRLAQELLAEAKLPSSTQSELRYWSAEMRRRNGDCIAALAGFSEVAQGDGPRAEDAQWSRVWCHARLKENETAKRYALDYLERFPGGRFKEQARDWVSR